MIVNKKLCSMLAILPIFSFFAGDSVAMENFSEQTIEQQKLNETFDWAVRYHFYEYRNVIGSYNMSFNSGDIDRIDYTRKNVKNTIESINEKINCFKNVKDLNPDQKYILSYLSKDIKYFVIEPLKWIKKEIDGNKLLSVDTKTEMICELRDYILDLYKKIGQIDSDLEETQESGHWNFLGIMFTNERDRWLNDVK